jgi:hypothetical protein
MNREIRPLVTDEPVVEFEKRWVQTRDLRDVTDPFF